MIINKAYQADVNHLVDLIKETRLYTSYFINKDLHAIVLKAVEKEEVDVLMVDGIIVGLLWSDQYGCFNKYPYLHMLVVSKDTRHKGYGTYLLNYFEDVLYEQAGKYFLMVADWNEAKALYEKNGYTMMTELPSFYTENINEYLMMKSK